MPIHTLDFTQKINAPRATAWAFFSNPANLSRITPPGMSFKTLTPDLPASIHPGLMITYSVKPMLGIPMKWLTEITHVREGDYFVDEQRIGPYSIWHHEHWFEDAAPGQTLMRDKITYVLPLGHLGNLVHPFLVKPQLDNIFAYRRLAVQEIFGPIPAAPTA